jgi:hypothetical protein
VGLTRFCVAAAVALCAASAFAAPVIQVDISTSGIYDHYSVAAEGDPGANGTFSLGGIGYGTDFSCDWSIVVNPDPSITGLFTLTNISAAPQTFTMQVTLPVAALGAPTRMGGSLGNVQYFDANGNSTVTIANGSLYPLYRAQIDGVGVHDILGSFSQTASGGPGASGTIFLLDWGTPIPSDPGPGVTSTISVISSVNLTPGDRVIIPVFFQVEAPEPTAGLLVGLGVAGLAVLRRARR